ncbi:MAG: bifunctional phosphopantothenoylcysteine decarboxylase/phosphopantothenate--cysteine ligase CoaBC [Bacteroidia bacterium]|nr:bifunctional phosphopantothenoylcysteine decarboxylase/phosphopantothenate--cysteine ligase CoaBC [Bacteroidia bacterium]
MLLAGKKILLGVTGSIAAYKSAILIRLLVKNGAEVKVVMTADAKEFITPLTLGTLSKSPVLTSFSSSEDGTWNNHVELGLWADLLLIAPATANTIGKMANGICDNLLLAVYLSARCKTYIAPAMDLDMHAHPSVTANLKKLQSFGNVIIEAEDGELASGLNGKGRMTEPEHILEKITNALTDDTLLKGKRVLVTAGPTHENIDPVRFIGNHSSGKMGFALAEDFAAHGAEVILVTGPTDEKHHHPNIKRIDVVSAADMFNTTVKEFRKSQVAVMSAAVADFTPQKVEIKKIKKSSTGLTLKLKKTKDILAELGKNKTRNQVLVGFALETDNEVENAKKKLRNKNLDFIVLNSLKAKGAGFKHETNQVTIIDKNLETSAFPLKSKQEVARDIVNKVIQLLA